MAKKDEIEKVVYKSIYLVLKTPRPPSLADFRKMKVADLDLVGNSPRDWPTFWAEAMTGEILEATRNELKIIVESDPEFDHTWFNSVNRTMNDLVELITNNQIPIPQVASEDR